jgi:uncharacterized damage-inducible protein DinB
MFRTVEDFQQTWKAESDMTLRVFGELSDKALAQSVGFGGYTLGWLARHVTGAVVAISAHAGLVPKPAESPALEKVADIIEAYTRNVKQVADAIAVKWSDAQLGEEIPMFGRKFRRGAALAFLISHQAHHRAQMTVLMRQAGLRVPGVYGPSEDDKAAMAAKQ